MDVAVGLVESYLRANGYLTVTELQVEREQGGRFEAATDLDILAIRLPWAAEVVARRPGAPDRVLLQDPALDVSRTGSDVLIGEVKEGAAQLNRALQTQEVLYAALRRIGCCSDDHIRTTAEELTRSGEVRVSPPHGLDCRIRLASFAGYVEDPLPSGVLSITLAHIVEFIARRFREDREILRGVAFHDPVLASLRLLDKLSFDLGRPRGT